MRKFFVLQNSGLMTDAGMQYTIDNYSDTFTKEEPV